jgi:hypothetical protein
MHKTVPGNSFTAEQRLFRLEQIEQKKYSGDTALRPCVIRVIVECRRQRDVAPVWIKGG